MSAASSTTRPAPATSGACRACAPCDADHRHALLGCNARWRGAAENGFLGDVFSRRFLDTHAAMQWLLPLVATLAELFQRGVSGFTVDARPAATGLPRTSTKRPFFHAACRWLLVLMCIVVGMLPAPVVGPTPRWPQARPGMPGPALPAHELAIWHGLNATDDGSPVRWRHSVRHAAAGAMPGATVSGFRLSMADACLKPPLRPGTRVGMAGNKRLQWQMLWLVVAALLAGFMPLWIRWAAARRDRLTPSVTRFCTALAAGRHVRHYRRPGRPNTTAWRRSHAAGRRGLGHLHYLLVVLGPGPGPHADRGWSW